jgi:hypothetical protein
MDRTTDLETAVGFVVRRIEELAKESGHPLNDEEHLLLKTLPQSNTSLSWMMAPELGPPNLIPRNMNLERLCALAKAAYENDRRMNPKSRDWEFAFAVFKLNQDPMSGLLDFAGVEMVRRTVSDQLLLIVAAVLPVMGIALFVISGPATLVRAIGIFGGMVAIMLFIYLGSRRVETQWLENHIERCRVASRNIRWKTS